MIITPTATGLVGEHIAAAVIIRETGFQTALCQQDKVDLLAWQDDFFVRVQVKSATIRQRNRNSKPGYQFQTGSGSRKKILPNPKDIDVVCFVAIDNRRCLFMAAEQVQFYTRRFSEKYFDNPAMEAESWEKSIRIVKDRIK